MKTKSAACPLGLLLVAAAATLCGQVAPVPPPAPANPAPAGQAVPAQDQTAKPVPDQTTAGPTNAAPKAHLRRFSYGIRGEWWSAQPFHGKGYYVLDNTTSQTVSSTSDAGRYAIGPVVDFNITSRISIQAETYYEDTQYTAITTNYTGSPPVPANLVNTLTEHTRSSYWDFPLLAIYQGPKVPKIRGRLVIEAGGVIRKLNRVWTGNDTLNADNSTAYNEIPTVPAHHTVEGAIVGLGLRWVDEVHLKITPDIRYIYWNNPIFESGATLSRTRQIQVGLSFVY